MNNKIQVQVEFRQIKRVFVTVAPHTYDELLSLIVSNIKRIDIATCCLMYENDEGDYVVLSKDDYSLSVAIQSSKKIPGVINLKRLKVKVMECTSPSNKTHMSADIDGITRSFSTGMKELSPGHSIISSPAGKRCRVDKQAFSASSSSTDDSRRKRLDFTEQSNLPKFPDNAKTPLARYIEKTEVSIANEEERLRSLLEEREDIMERLEEVKSYPSEGKLCRKCHLRLGHTARSCTYGPCESVFCCGEEKFHAGEINTKDLDSAIRKKESTLKTLKAELESKKDACNSLKETLSRRIETDLMQVNGDEYMYYGHKNWTLLRKHVHALEQYCKREYNGKIPAKKDLKNVLKNALRCGALSLNPSTVRAKQRHENPAKHTLERYGVEFPTHPPMHPSTQQSSSSVDTSSLYYRCKPSCREEEEAQFQTALMESRATATSETNTLPTPEVRHVLGRPNPSPSESVRKVGSSQRLSTTNQCQSFAVQQSRLQGHTYTRSSEMIVEEPEDLSSNNQCQLLAVEQSHLKGHTYINHSMIPEQPENQSEWSDDDINANDDATDAANILLSLME